MVVLVQRCSRAAVRVEGTIVGRIERGLAVFVGWEQADPQSHEMLDRVAAKIAMLRVFPDGEGRMNLSVGQVGGGVLLIPNFTLAGDCARGNRPSFAAAMAPDAARAQFEALAHRVGAHVANTQVGRFGADMRVEVDNDGPVSLVLRFAGTQAGAAIQEDS